jgi:hypothetical protein
MLPAQQVFISNKNALVAWYCQSCGRIEAAWNARDCPKCGARMQRCSRYEWFLCDSLQTILAFQGADFDLYQQYPVLDRRGFTWFFDIYVWVRGNSFHGGYGELIEINGQTHITQKPYARIGYTRDFDKYAETIYFHRFQDSGIHHRTVSNEECTKKRAFYTAVDIADELMDRALSVY